MSVYAARTRRCTTSSAPAVGDGAEVVLDVARLTDVPPRDGHHDEVAEQQDERPCPAVGGTVEHPDEHRPGAGEQVAGALGLSLIHISEPTRRTPISYAVFCLN